MKFNNENMEKLLSEITMSSDINLSDIPDIDLYMDQVTSLFEKKLNFIKRDEADKIMTKTMINNYAKAKIFPPVKSKKYNKKQIILLSLIYNLKQNLSLNDIGTVFKPILEDIQSDEKNLLSIEEIYDIFLKIKKTQLQEFESNFDTLISLIRGELNNLEEKEKGMTELILLVFMLITQANIEKRMAEKIIDNFFKIQE